MARAMRRYSLRSSGFSICVIRVMVRSLWTAALPLSTRFLRGNFRAFGSLRHRAQRDPDEADDQQCEADRRADEEKNHAQERSKNACSVDATHMREEMHRRCR